MAELEGKLTPEQLGEILEKHRKWVESGEKEGKRANLFHANLQKANLFEAKLQNADLIGAKLQNAALIGADLQGANLSQANLHEAALFEANLKDSILQNADLTGVTGLLAGQLAGANVSGAKLPEDIARFEGLNHVEETSRNARRMFFAMLLGCVYSWLTIATTTDARLLTNSASSPLPIIGTAIPIVGFYLAAPLILVGFYIYLHLYLQRLWESLADLPAVFPDGRPLDRRAYPWLPIGLVRAHFKLLRKERPALSRLQNGISILLVWGIVPFTFFLFWGRYLSRHEWVGTGLHIALLVISIGFGLLSYCLCRGTLRGNERKPLRWKKLAWLDGRTYQSAGILGIGFFLALVSLGAVEGKPNYDEHDRLSINGVRTWVPYAFAFIGFSTFANLDEVDVSNRPTSWTGRQEDIALVKGAHLKGRDLRYARAQRAFLVNADLRLADLRGANLFAANLRGANLVGANLQEAYLQEANLQRANLTLANLTGADLIETNLAGANLCATDLRKPKNPPTPRQVKAAYNWDLAFYSDDFLDELGLQPDSSTPIARLSECFERKKKADTAKP